MPSTPPSRIDQALTQLRRRGNRGHPFQQSVRKPLIGSEFGRTIRTAGEQGLDTARFFIRGRAKCICRNQRIQLVAFG